MVTRNLADTQVTCEILQAGHQFSNGFVGHWKCVCMDGLVVLVRQLSKSIVGTIYLFGKW